LHADQVFRNYRCAFCLELSEVQFIPLSSTNLIWEDMCDGDWKDSSDYWVRIISRIVTEQSIMEEMCEYLTH
jgi:hypothetical protein